MQILVTSSKNADMLLIPPVRNWTIRPLDFGAASSAASRQGKGDVGRSQRWKNKKEKEEKKKNLNLNLIYCPNER